MARIIDRNAMERELYIILCEERHPPSCRRGFLCVEAVLVLLPLGKVPIFIMVETYGAGSVTFFLKTTEVVSRNSR